MSEQDWIKLWVTLAIGVVITILGFVRREKLIRFLIKVFLRNFHLARNPPKGRKKEAANGE